MSGRIINVDNRHRVVVTREQGQVFEYKLEKFWNGREWEAEFEIHVQSDGCTNMFAHTPFHMCAPAEADALASAIKACMADAKARIG